MPEIVLGILFLALILLGIISCLVKYQRFIRDHKICPHCGSEMTVVWVGEKIDPRKEKVRFGGKRVIGGEITQFTPHLRCGQCSHEIPIDFN